MAQHLNVTVMYGENKLQKTISLPATATVAAAKQAGSVEITNHLRLQAGVPLDLSIDDECTDFYPGMILSPKVVYIVFYIADVTQLLQIKPRYEI